MEYVWVLTYNQLDKKKGSDIPIILSKRVVPEYFFIVLRVGLLALNHIFDEVSHADDEHYC